MMTENDRLLEIERLSRHEFNLDVAGQKQLQAQCEVEVEKVGGGVLQCYLLLLQSARHRMGFTIDEFSFLLLVRRVA